MTFDVTIPIKPHLKKYVLRKFNSRKSIRITSTNMLGLAFMNMFTERPDIYRKEFAITFTDELTIEFSGEFSNRFGFFISKQNIYYLNKALYDEFKERLFDYLDGMKADSDSFEINKSILLFCSKFSISEEEIALETLRKSYQRYRKAQESKPNNLNISQQN